MFEKAFMGVESTLMNELLVDKHLIDLLWTKAIITRRHYEALQRAGSPQDRVEMLLFIIQRRNDTLFRLFCDVLRENGQGHVESLILSNAKD